MAPSSKLGLYLATVVLAYSLTSLAWVTVILGCTTAAALSLGSQGRRDLWKRYGGKLVGFVVSIFLIRILLEWAGRGVISASLESGGLIYPAARDAVRIAILVLGAAVVQTSTHTRDIVREMELIHVPRSGRLLVMMVVQFPKILERRHAQITEAQVARGGERPVTLRQRVTYGLSLLLPILQSELNAVGDRAALIHTRRLDVETPCNDSWIATRSGTDATTWLLAGGVLVAAIVIRVRRA